MNKAILMGRLTRDPDVRYSQGENPMAIARYTLAVDRRFKRDGEQNLQRSISNRVQRLLFPEESRQVVIQTVRV